ncbi:MAG: transglutaminase domain-containing protein, partial [Bacteroidota bacterium]
QQFIYDQPGSLASWQDLGQWSHRLLETASDLPVTEKVRLRALVEDIPEADMLERVKRIYHFVQDETRYINVTIDNGGLKPYPASYVARNKYGDCKALSNYMRTALDAVGIEAYYSKIFAGSPIQRVDQTLPSSQFNHIIVCVPIQEDTLWLDCTSKGPFDYQGTFIQNRQALVVADGNSHFQWVPALSPEDVQRIRSVVIQPLTGGKTTAQFRQVYRGDDFEKLDYISRNYAGTDLRKRLRQYFVPGTWTPNDELEVKRSGRDARMLTLTYKAETRQGFKKYGPEQLMRLMPFELPEFEAPAQRHQPVQMDYPISQTDTLQYYFPEGTRPSSWPENIEIESPFGRYTLQAELLDDHVRIIKSCLIYSGTYDMETYPAFYAFLQSIAKQESGAYIVVDSRS